MQHRSDLEGLLEHIKQTGGFDFTGYKRASLERRILQRMQCVGCGSFADYVDFLEVHPAELPALFSAILINVTTFFRDAESWAVLSGKVVPQLLSRRTNDSTTRVWSAACASGEETYTLAIVFAEALGLEAFKRSVKIYATDVDEDALATARIGSYSKSDLGEMPEHLVAKYFDRRDGRFVFRDDLRGQIVFGRHDLIQDAPISCIDMLVCRNALMYFTAEAQASVLAGFQLALNDDGILFLGGAESLMTHAVAFVPIDLEQRISSKTPTRGSTVRAKRRQALPRVIPDTSASQQTMRDALETANEALETAKEALRSTNERLASMNQELQSTNHELRTMDAELRRRDVDRDQANDFLETILASMGGAVMVLDGQLRVIVWNESARELWGIREQARNDEHVGVGLPMVALRPHIDACLDGTRPTASVRFDSTSRFGEATTSYATISPLFNRGGTIHGVIVAADETTGIRSAMRARN